MKKLVLLFVILLASANGFAVDYTTNSEPTVNWIAASGNWMDQANWQDYSVEGGTPVNWAIPGWVGNGTTIPWNPYNTGYSTDFGWNDSYAKISSGICNLTSASGPDGRVRALFVGGDTSTTLNISSNLSLYKGSYIGAGAGATTTINQTAGTFIEGTTADATCQAYWGQGAGSTVYNLSGGSLTTAGNEDFWAHTTGSSFTFNQTGGSYTDTAAAAKRLNVGFVQGSTGIINLSGSASTFTAEEIRLGTNGSGTLTQNGGTFVANGYVHLALNANATGAQTSGAVNLNNGSFTVKGAQIRVGSRGNGAFTQTGGSFRAEQNVLLGYAATATGVYSISGGTYQTDISTQLGYNSTFSVIGSGATSIRTQKFEILASGNATDQILKIKLDGNGSTLIQVYGSDNAILTNGILEVDTLAGFDGVFGDVYDILWSAADIITTDLTFNNLSSTQFSWAVVDKAYNGIDGKMLQLTVLPEPATVCLLALGGMFFVRRKNS